MSVEPIIILCLVSSKIAKSHRSDLRRTNTNPTFHSPFSSIIFIRKNCFPRQLPRFAFYIVFTESNPNSFDSTVSSFLEFSLHMYYKKSTCQRYDSEKKWVPRIYCHVILSSPPFCGHPHLRLPALHRPPPSARVLRPYFQFRFHFHDRHLAQYQSVPILG